MEVIVERKVTTIKPGALAADRRVEANEIASVGVNLEQVPKQCSVLVRVCLAPDLSTSREYNAHVVRVTTNGDSTFGNEGFEV